MLSDRHISHTHTHDTVGERMCVWIFVRMSFIERRRTKTALNIYTPIYMCKLLHASSRTNKHTLVHTRTHARTRSHQRKPVNRVTPAHRSRRTELPLKPSYAHTKPHAAVQLFELAHTTDTLAHLIVRPRVPKCGCFILVRGSTADAEPLCHWPRTARAFTIMSTTTGDTGA